jgi:hypothetical protein
VFVSRIGLLAGLDRRCSRVDRLLKHVLKTRKTHKLRSIKSRIRLFDTKVHRAEAFDTRVHGVK